MMDKKINLREGRKLSEESSTSSYTTSSVSSDDESDTCDIKLIKEYLTDRKELARQLFKSVKPEKLRMMLPQVLKRMDVNELEEWCVSELSGMSTARILSILNGQPMLESSDSDNTDDSGPSLEIISDTEEWPTEDESAKKDEKMSPTSKKTKLKKDKAKFKSKLPVQKKNDKDKAKSKLKVKHKLGDESKFNETKIKKKGEKAEAKDNKEGDSLLDLLELEMRARAIRALIRKEEDIIPTVSSAQGVIANSNLTAATSTVKDRNLSLRTVEEKLKEMDKNYREVEQISTDAMQGTAGDDEDVVLVVQPTPMIELLSSGSDDEEQGKRRNQKLENERTIDKVQNVNSVMDDKTKSLNNRLNDEERVTVNDETTKSSNVEVDVNSKEIVNNQDKVVNDKVKKVTNNDADSGVDALTNRDLANKVKTEVSNSTGKKLHKKGKKRSQSKKKDKFINSLEESDKVISKSIENVRTAIETTEKVTNIEACELTVTRVENPVAVSSDNAVETKGATMEENKCRTLETEKTDVDQHLVNVNSERKEKEVDSIINAVILDEDKSGDLEVIIDLDDYPDDMDDIENSDKDNRKKVIRIDERLEQNKNNTSEEMSKETTDHAETWATRYYQTDDVQNVIKESRIQSEIRKRLRERQRLARLSNSRSTTAILTPTVPEDKNNKTAELKPTGSVEEYLALKGTASLSLNTSDSNSSNNTISEKSIVYDTNEAAMEIDKPIDLNNETDTMKSEDTNTITDASTVSDTKNIEADVSTELFPD